MRLHIAKTGISKTRMPTLTALSTEGVSEPYGPVKTPLRDHAFIC